MSDDLHSHVCTIITKDIPSLITFIVIKLAVIIHEETVLIVFAVGGAIFPSKV